MEESKEASPSVAPLGKEDERSDEEMWKADPDALFNYDGVKLFSPNAIQNIWGEFVMEFMEAVWLKDFKTFEDNASLLNHDTGVAEDLARMIKNSLDPEQKLVVGKEEYKIIIEKSLYLLPAEKSKVTEEDRLPMCKGMKIVLDRYGFDVQPEMVNQDIIETTGLVFECDYNVYKHADNMRYAGEHLTKISGTHVEDWDLFKLATAVMIVAYPNGEQVVASNPEKLFGNDYPTLPKDAPKYKDKLREVACFRVYREMLRARKIRHKALKQLVLLTRLAREDYDAQKARNHG